jgi:photosystem II stability/assembly factor-like uncharacterized protein
MVTPYISRLFLLAAATCALVAPAGAKDKDTIALSDIRQNLFSACFSSPTDGWIVGELGRVFHTADRGKTFTRSETGTRDAFLTVACLPNGTVFVAGQHGKAILTTDQGKTWKQVDTGTKRDLLAVDFANDQIGIAVGDFGTMIRTEDGGLSWSTIPLPADLKLPEDVAEIVDPGDVLLYDVDFASPERGWAVGEFGVIFTTADGGKTWTTQQSGVETTLFGVQFADQNLGFATGIEQVLLRTTDGGQTWDQVDVVGHKGFVLGLYDVAVQGKIGWVVGDSGLILRTTDGGLTWKAIDLPIRLVGNWFRGVALTPGADGIIVGSEGEILLTEGDQYRELEKPRS